LKKTFNTLLCCTIICTFWHCGDNKPSNEIAKTDTSINDTIKINELLNSVDTAVNIEESFAIHLEAKKQINKVVMEKTITPFILKSLARSINNEGYFASIFQKKGNELPYYFKALGVVKKTDDYNTAAAIYNNIGCFYVVNEDPDLAVFYFNKAIDNYRRAGDTKELAYIYTNMAISMLVKGDTIETLKLYRYGLSSISDTSDVYKQLKGNILNNIGKIYRKKNNIGLAIDYLKQAEHIQKRINDNLGLVETYHNYGNVLLKINKEDSALYFFSTAHEIANKGKYNTSKNDILESLVEYYKKKGNTKKAEQFENELKANQVKKTAKEKVKTDTVALNKVKEKYLDSLFKP
jgi:tetratricopeptide (TPR) repeat protein